jgi:hypothetical protein
MNRSKFELWLDEHPEIKKAVNDGRREWDAAMRSGKLKTWWVYKGYGSTAGKFIKCYTDAATELVMKRTGWILEQFGHDEME